MLRDMKSIRVLTIVILALIIITSSFITSCKKETQIMKIGAVLPLTGPGSSIGTWQRQGIELAVKEINSNGGIKGKRLEVLYKDSKLTAKDAVSATNSLLMKESQLPVIIMSASSPSNAVLPIIDEKGIVMPMIAVSYPKIAGRSEWAFRFNVGSDDEAEIMSRFLSNELKIKRVSILYVNDDFGRGAKEAFIEYYKDLGGEIVFAESYGTTDSDFKSILAKVKTYNSEALYIIGYTKAAAIAIRQVKEVGIKAKVLSNMAMTVPAFREIVSEGIQNVYYSTCLFDPSSKDEKVQSFVAKYNELYNQDPTFFSAFAYDAMKLLAYAIKKGGFKPEEIKNAMLNISNFKGVTGNHDIMPDGNVEYPVQIVKLRNNHLISVFK